MDENLAQNQEEIFDFVDENDNVIGTATRAEVHQKNLFHRAVHAIFFNSKGEILLQKRSARKDTYPLCYTTSCSGHVDSNESYEQALIRETFEELGVKLSLSDFVCIGKIPPSANNGFEFTKVFIGKIPPSANNGFEFTKVFFTKFDGIFNFSKVEIESIEWLDIPNFEKLTKENPEKITPSFLTVYTFYKQNQKL